MTANQFADAYANHYPGTTRFLLSRGIPPATAEEISQAAWARGWERLGALREASKIGAWVNTIALNLLRRHIRTAKRHVALYPNWDSPALASTADRRDAEKMLGALSAEDRKILLMYAVHGCTSQEIGDACKLSAVAVRVRLCRAKARLRELFGELPEIGTLAQLTQQPQRLAPVSSCEAANLQNDSMEHLSAAA